MVVDVGFNPTVHQFYLYSKPADDTTSYEQKKHISYDMNNSSDAVGGSPGTRSGPGSTSGML